MDAHDDIIHFLKAVRLPSGRTVLVSASRHGVMRRWDTGTWEQIGSRVELGEENISSLDTAVLHGRARVFTADGDRRVQEWDAATGELAADLGQVDKVAALLRPDWTRKEGGL
ncbi:WD40 repeat domain-containing protein [Streptomyces sp. IBSBF 2435]|uniref:WD40 repeat domain-containing protein n=1 Tax=Streptomyces sp. IBSBF 2435 TaxID=2903531 RepID=UPI002FDBC6F4